MILVTGATGFLGSELVRQLLLKGEKVRALKRPSSVIPKILQNQTEIEWVEADLLNYFELRDAMQKIRLVFHCAAHISFDPSERRMMMQINVQGTTNLVNVCMECNISKLVHVSSVAAIGESLAGVPATERDHLEIGGRNSAYSVSKFESEMEVFRGHAEGLPVVVVNPGIIIGKNCGTKGSGQLIEAIRKGLKYYPGGTFGYVDVEDVAQIMIRLMESPINGERFIITAENWSYKDFFREAALQLNRKPPSIAIQPWMLTTAYWASKIISLFNGKKYGLTPDTIRSSFKKRVYSNEKVRAALGIEFKPLRQSIAEICNP